MIISNQNEYPVVEYGTSGECFLDTAIEESKELAEDDSDQTVKKNNSKIYYLGGQNYIAQHKLKNNKTVTYDVSTGDVKKVNKKTLQQNETDETYITRQETNERDIAYKALESTYKTDTATCSEMPPDEKYVVITGPGQYETGYNYYFQRDCSNWDLDYTTTNQYDLKYECGPVAVTNFFKWYVTYASSKYKSLKYKTWKDTTYRLYKLMKTNVTKDGTLWDDFDAGVKTYLHAQGFTGATAKTKHTLPKDVIDKLDYNNSILISVVDNRCYGTHTMLALGYMDFGYKGGKHSKYIRVANGWTSKADRFIWWYTSGGMRYCSVNFK